MSRSDPRSWVDKAVGVCLGVLIGAVAIYIAVKLIEAVAAALLVMLGIALTVVLGAAIIRSRSQRW